MMMASGPQVKRLNGIVVQSAVAGKGITWFRGTTRLGVNLLWFGNFKAKAQKAQGGKGGSPQTTGYSYTAALVLGICQGPIDGVRTVYRDKQVIPLASSGLSLKTGAAGQAPWAFIDTVSPGQGIGYSEVAYLYAPTYSLGDQATVGNHSVEAQSSNRYSGSDDANPAVVVTDFLPTVPSWPSGMIDSLTDYSDYCLANSFLLSPAIDDQMSAADFLTDLMRASNSAIIWSEGKLKIRPYGDVAATGNSVTWTPNLTPIYSISSADMIPESPDDPPMLVDLKRPTDAYNYIQIEYLDRSKNYNKQVMPGVEQAAIDQFGLRKKDKESLPAICNTATAAKLAQILVQRSAYVRATFRFRLPWTFCLVEPMDILAVTHGPYAGKLIRVTKIDEDGDSNYQVEAEELLVGTGSSPAVSRQDPNGYISDQGVDPGNTTAPVVINPPRALTGGSLEVWLAAAGGANWGGCEVYTSFDGTTYSLVGRVEAPARYGVTTTSMSTHADPDTTGTVGVNLANSLGELMPATQADVDSVSTPCLVGNEVIAYRDATLTGTNAYTLGYLRRGQFGTTIATHAIGSTFVRLDDRIFELPYLDSQIGQTIYIKFRSFNIYGYGYQDLASVTPITFTLAPSSATFTVVDWANIGGSGKPQDNADVTATHTAAAITGQGALATRNDVANAQIQSNAVDTPNVIADAITIYDTQVQTSGFGGGGRITFVYNAAMNVYTQLDSYTFTYSGYGDVTVEWNGMIQWQANASRSVNIFLCVDQTPSWNSFTSLDTNYTLLTNWQGNQNALTTTPIMALTLSGLSTGSHTISIWSKAITSGANQPFLDYGATTKLFVGKR